MRELSLSEFVSDVALSTSQCNKCCGPYDPYRRAAGVVIERLPRMRRAA